MKIGFLAESSGMQSLKYVFQGIEQALVGRHEIIYRPREYFFASPRRQEELHEEFLLGCDVAIGRIEESFLRSRARLDRQPPLIGFLLGVMSRGGFDLARFSHYLKTTDVLVGNCTADVEIAGKFFRNAQIRNLPFAFDQETFYPSDESRRRALKAELGFREEDKILLYAGRITLEKNLQAVLRILSVLQELVPDLHLVVAGELENTPFAQFGLYTVNITGTVMKLLGELRLDPKRVHFLGRKNPAQLRDLYTVADVLVNMTLHHDENFGFAQVEAMACGTPVVGTSWGGLKDTIKHGETGYQISAAVTGSGIKINWWEAISRIVYLLEDEAALGRFRERCPIHASESYSPTRYCEILESILQTCVQRSKHAGEPLRPTDFADQFWAECQPRVNFPPPFQRGPRSFELYKELIAPFTGTTENLITSGEALRPDHLLLLAAPVETEDGSIQINDPIYPLELAVPKAQRESCEAALAVLRKEPVIELKRLESLVEAPARAGLEGALRWMLEAGLLLRTRPMDAGINPRIIGGQMAKPVFSMQNVDFTTDVVVIR